MQWLFTLALLAVPLGLAFFVFRRFYRQHTVQQHAVDTAVAAGGWTITRSDRRYLWQITGTFQGHPFEATCTRPHQSAGGTRSPNSQRATVTVQMPGGGVLLEPQALENLPAFVRQVATPFSPPGAEEIRRTGSSAPVAPGADGSNPQWGGYLIWTTGGDSPVPSAELLEQLTGYIRRKTPVVASWWQDTLTITVGGSTASDPLPLLSLTDVLVALYARS